MIAKKGRVAVSAKTFCTLEQVVALADLIQSAMFTLRSKLQ